LVKDVDRALRALERTGGRPLARRMLDNYLTVSREWLLELTDGVRNGRLEEVERAAHSIAGSAAYVGALGVQELAHQMEAAAEAGDLSTAARILPALTEAADAAAALLRQKRDAAQKSARVGVVEDNADIRLLLRMMLEREYSVDAFGNGADALAAFTEKRPDVVLLDLSLPDMDGMEVLRRMRAEPVLADVPAVAVTAKASRADREKYLRLGFDDYVTKPILSEPNLLGLVKRLLVATSLPGESA
jgi:CheY-like chemotaxis protein